MGGNKMIWKESSQRKNARSHARLITNVKSLLTKKLEKFVQTLLNLSIFMTNLTLTSYWMMVS